MSEIGGAALSIPTEQREYDDLQFYEKVYLGALCMALPRDNSCEIAPQNCSSDLLAPTDYLTEDIYTELLCEKDIYSVNGPHINAFRTNDYRQVASSYYAQVAYKINIRFPKNKESFFKMLKSPHIFSDETLNDALLMWTTIATAECIQFFSHQIEDIGLHLPVEDETVVIYETLLKRYSIRQIVGIIINSQKCAEAKCVARMLPTEHIVDYMISYCKNAAKQATTEEWSQMNLNWQCGLQKSVLSQYFYYRVTKLGDQAYTEIPNIEALKSMLK